MGTAVLIHGFLPWQRAKVGGFDLGFHLFLTHRVLEVNIEITSSIISIIL